MPRLGVVALLLVASHGAIAADPTAHAVPARPSIAIGYTTHATALAGGRRANVATSRAMLLLPDRAPVELVPDLAAEPDSWTQFAGWFPDGATAIVGRGWESRDNAAWEEEHREFRFRSGDWLYDTWLVDLPTGRADNVTAVERVSFFNSGLFAWPGDPTRLGFTALVDGISKPFVMDRDGRGKTDLARESRGFAYGFSGSPDGCRVAYHEDYQVWLADADGGNRIRIDTGQPFNFAPSWSPDGRWLLFLAGTHYDCHPHVVRADGSGLRKLADRGGYRGVTQFLDVPDFHDGSSDVPAWSHDGRAVWFTARVKTAPPGGDTATSPETVELFRILLDEGATPERLTVSVPGSTHYHPRPSPDGVWLLIGSRRASAGGMARNLFARRIADGVEVQLTHVPPGRAAMHGHWQPVAVPPAPALVPAAAAPAK